MDVCERALSDDASLSDDLQPPGLSLVGEPSYLLTDINIWTRRLRIAKDKRIAPMAPNQHTSFQADTNVIDGIVRKGIERRRFAQR